MGSRIFELYRRAAMGNGDTGEDLSFISLESDISPGMTKTISKSAAFNPPMGTQGNLRIAIEPHGFVPSPESTLQAENTWINAGTEG